MITYIRRVIILLALLALGYLWFDGPGAAGEKDGEEKRWSLEERQERLDATVAKRWDARSNGDWVTVYELFSPEFRSNSSLTSYMQNKDKFHFGNWEILDTRIEKDLADVKVKYDWGLNLNMKIDLGEPFKSGVVSTERYEFDAKTGDWYFKQNVLKKKQ